jgi:hypothetical protein
LALRLADQESHQADGGLDRPLDLGAEADARSRFERLATDDPQRRRGVAHRAQQGVHARRVPRREIVAVLGAGDLLLAVEQVDRARLTAARVTESTSTSWSIPSRPSSLNARWTLRGPKSSTMAPSGSAEPRRRRATSTPKPWSPKSTLPIPATSTRLMTSLPRSPPQLTGVVQESNEGGPHLLCRAVDAGAGGFSAQGASMSRAAAGNPAEARAPGFTGRADAVRIATEVAKWAHV